MLNLIVVLISLIVFYACKSRVSNDDTYTRRCVYGSVTSKYHNIYIIVCVASVITSLLFAYLTYHNIVIWMGKIQ